MRPLSQLEVHKRKSGKGSKPRSDCDSTYDIHIGGGRNAPSRTITVQIKKISGWTRLRVTVKSGKFPRQPDTYELCRVRQLFFFKEEFVLQYIEEPNSNDFIDIWEKQKGSHSIPRT